MNEGFSPDWLALREPFDHAARSLVLARRLVERLPQRPHLVDLGGGTGSLFRFLAPQIARGQDWTLVDADGALLDDAFGRTAAWGRRQGFAATAEGDTLALSTPRGLWRLRVVQQDFAASEQQHTTGVPPPFWPLQAGHPRLAFAATTQVVDGVAKPRHDEGVRAVTHSADAIVCSALLDLVSPAWLEHLCATLTVPLLACLVADGRDTWQPRHPLDPQVRRAFQRDMRRDKGFGPALGISAWRALTRRGAASATSDWRIPRTALRMQRALIDGTADAARRASPAHAAAITAWQAARLLQAVRGRLAITIGHRDILLLPPGG